MHRGGAKIPEMGMQIPAGGAGRAAGGDFLVRRANRKR